MMIRRLALIGLVVMTSVSAFAQRGRVIGQLAQALESTKIYKSPNSKSRAYYTAKQYQYLVVNEGDGRYLKVVMSNGINGYVKKDFVAQLPYKVTTENLQSRGGGSSSRAAAANKGLNYVGTPYVWGGNDLNGGIDCSGFVQKLYGEIGINLPRVASDQAKVGTPITRLQDLRAGDRLYFWEKKRGKIGHTGMYLGNGHFVHSSRGHNGVATDVLSEKWRKILVAARR